MSKFIWTDFSEASWPACRECGEPGAIVLVEHRSDAAWGSDPEPLFYCAGDCSCEPSVMLYWFWVIDTPPGQSGASLTERSDYPFQRHLAEKTWGPALLGKLERYLPSSQPRPEASTHGATQPEAAPLPPEAAGVIYLTADDIEPLVAGAGSLVELPGVGLCRLTKVDPSA